MWPPEPRQKFRENKSLFLAPIVPPCGAVQSQALDSVVCPSTAGSILGVILT